MLRVLLSWGVVPGWGGQQSETCGLASGSVPALGWLGEQLYGALVQERNCPGPAISCVRASGECLGDVNLPNKGSVAPGMLAWVERRAPGWASFAGWGLLLGAGPGTGAEGKDPCEFLRRGHIMLVGMRGFEPPVSASRTRRSTRLSHIPLSRGRLLAESNQKGKCLGSA